MYTDRNTHAFSTATDKIKKCIQCYTMQRLLDVQYLYSQINKHTSLHSDNVPYNSKQILGWMIGIQRIEKIRTEEIRARVGMVKICEEIREARLR